MLPGLLNGPDGLAKLVETVLNQILEAQVEETLGVGAGLSLRCNCIGGSIKTAYPRS